MTPFLLHHWLQSSAARFPDRVAVSSQGHSLTYAQLELLSNRLANSLRRQAVVTGDRVGIDLEKSIAAIVAMFGILKAGACYVPLDPRAPVKRLGYVVGNCRMRGLVTTPERLARLIPALESVPAAQILFAATDSRADMTWQGMESDTDTVPPDPGLLEQDLAYILYTSGSTGQPKGVMLSHRAALTFVNWALDYFQLQPQDVLANHAPLHFDLSIFDIFAATAAGACVALVPASASVFPRSLADWIENNGISVWYSVPSILTQLALNGALNRHAFARLRLVLFAGEVFPTRHLRNLLQQWTRPRFFNLYGPTESNVCTVFEVRELPAEDTPIPIGSACSNTEVFSLNDRGAEAAVGEDGELYVRGPSLMDGYWGLAEQTARNLLPDPRHPERAGRVYRTGDIVRRDAAGAYHFVGRRDLQVKSRGYRIELGDIEATLHKHAGVAEVAIVAVPHAEFGSTLHGIIAPRPGMDLQRAELAAWCATYLPPYMVPAEFEIRESLPKTSNGKVDRAVLQREALVISKKRSD